jgi:HEAT repeat protein
MKHLFLAVVSATAMLLLAPCVAWSKPPDPDPIYPSGGTKRVSDWVRILRSDPDVAQRKRALLVMKLIGPKPRAVIPALCSVLASDKDVEMRAGAAAQLGQFYPEANKALIDMREAAEALKEALAGEKKDADDSVREAAASSLGQMGQDAHNAVPALIEALKDKPSIQITAADAIDHLAKDADDNPTRDSNAAEAMLELLKNPAAAALARCSAATFLGRLNVDGGLTALIEVLGAEKSEPRLRKTIADVIGRYKEDGADAVPALAKALKDDNVDVRIAAGSALARVGSRALDALPQLREALKDKDPVVRIRAIDVIARLGADAVVALKDLIDCLEKERGAENRVAAIRAIGLMGPAAKDAIPIITKCSCDSNGAVKAAAVDALGKIDAK